MRIIEFISSVLFKFTVIPYYRPILILFTISVRYLLLIEHYEDFNTDGHGQSGANALDPGKRPRTDPKFGSI